MPYVHLSETEREVISERVFAGHSLTSIASFLGRSPGTISRELKRNRSKSGVGRFYSCAWAHREYQRRRSNSKKGLRPKIKRRSIIRYVKAKLNRDWSPEQIAGRMRLVQGPELSNRISHTSIYRWIKRDRKEGGVWHRRLRQDRRRRRKYGQNTQRFQMKGRVSIDDRPQIVERRSRIGDWEGDLMQGKNCTSYLLTYVDRRSGFLLVKKIPKKTSKHVQDATADLFKQISPKHRRTITFDNGTEFAGFRQIEAGTGMKTYFAHPYSSWERGTNENTNGLLRQYVPKETDIRRYSPAKLAKAARSINNRPRKRLGYQTPSEVLRNNT